MDEVLLTPAQRALAELNRVASLGLPEKGRYAEHYALLSKTLRAYVRDRFGLSAGERTPRELREDMLRAGIDRTETATIYEILREGETARFHRAVSYPARAQHAVRSALDAMRRAAVAEQHRRLRQRPDRPEPGSQRAHPGRQGLRVRHPPGPPPPRAGPAGACGGAGCSRPFALRPSSHSSSPSPGRRSCARRSSP